MDPLVVKFIQLIVAEILGASLAIAGVVLFLRGVAGKSTLVIQGAGVQAKLINSAPGGIVLIAGVIVLALSLHSSVERTEHQTVSTGALDEWLANSYHVTDAMDYKRVIDTIVGIAPDTHFVDHSMRLKETMTLGALAAQQLDNEKFWHLLAAINKDRGFFTLQTATRESKIPAGSIMEIWVNSKYNALDVQTISKVAAQDRAKGYDDLLALAKTGVTLSSVIDGLTEQFDSNELSVVLQEANLTGVRTLRELSLKYYRDPKYWPLFVWANPQAFSPGVTEDSPVVPTGPTLLLVTLLSGAHVE